MSELRVTHVFPVSFMPRPFVVGKATGDFTVGQDVTLRKHDGTIVTGKLESIDIHQRDSGELSLVFSEEISRHVQPGDVISS